MNLVSDDWDRGSLLVEHQVLDDVDGADVAARHRHHESTSLCAVWGPTRPALAGEVDVTLARDLTLTPGARVAHAASPQHLRTRLLPVRPVVCRREDEEKWRQMGLKEADCKTITVAYVS